MDVPSSLQITLIMSFKKHISLLEDAIPNGKNLEIFENISRFLAQDILEAASKKKLICIFGNGGSAADSSHWSTELVASYENRSRKAIPVISLSDSLPTITAIANDVNYENVFTRQIDAYANNLGLAIGLSTSGQSKNVLNALDKSLSYNAKTYLVTGNKYKNIGKYSNEVIFDSSHVGTIQTLTQIFYHSVCNEVERIIDN